MKSISVKFLAPVLALAAVFVVVNAGRQYFAVKQSVFNLIDSQAELALAFDLAIRGYVAEEIRPRVEECMPPGEFIPETMSTSYVARGIFEKVRRDFPEYIIKFSSDNPRNPQNLAGSDELRMIRFFNETPEAKTWKGEIELEGRPYVAHFSARRMSESCLRCHGRPEDAPASLLERYGDKAGFHLPIGTVIALDMVAIPLDKTESLILSDTFGHVLVMCVGLILLLLLIAATFRQVVTRRLNAIRARFEYVAAQPDATSLEPVEARGNDEISALTRSFNVMASRLREAQSALEQRVVERTAELHKANSELRKEAEVRLQAEQSAAVRAVELEQRTIELEKSRREATEMMERAEWARVQAEMAQEELRRGNDKLMETLRREKNIAMELEATMSQYEAAKRDAESASRELADKLDEMETFNQLAIGRELRMIELKIEINRLLEEQGKPPAYEVAGVAMPA